MTPAAAGSVARALERWFAHAARDMPWRRHRTPYRALVAEAMLQQTQASRVDEHYDAFLRRFPSVAALARASEPEVLTAWQGLGYYRRARHLHAAARMIVEEHDGRVPRTLVELMSLPGVGRYTGGSIASIVFGARAPIVDGNVQRVLARLEGNDASPVSPDTVRWFWAEAEKLVAAASDPGAVNEAIMELGATVCTPKGPRCDECPLANACVARRDGREGEIPRPKPAAKQQRVHHHAVIIRRGGKVLLEQRPGRGLWSAMWQTPTIEATRALRPGEVESRLALTVTGLERCTAFEHATTHRRIRFHVFAARSRVRRGTWRQPADAADLPMSNPQRRILKMV